MNGSRSISAGLLPIVGLVLVLTGTWVFPASGATEPAATGKYEGPAFAIPEGTGRIFRFATKAGRDVPNPHLRFECATCHNEVPDPGAPLDLALKGLKNEPARLCGTCHPDYVNIHPTGSAPRDATPVHLPLDGDGRLTCTTCHRMHVKSARFSLLRGFGEEEGYRFRARRDLCLSCHGDNFRALDPHQNRGREEMCVYCHLEVPEKGGDGKPRFRVNVMTMCNFCHGTGENFHPLNVNPALKIPDALPRAADGSVDCATCHNPHGSETVTYYLRKAYVLANRSSRNLKGHGTGADCSACHEKVPPAGAGDAQLHFGGNTIILCNSCHGSTPDPHPVDVTIPGTMRKPTAQPLSDAGKITCLTCHDVECEGPPGDPAASSTVTTRLFSRLKGDNSLCFQCHLKERWTGFTPHMEIDRAKVDHDPNHCLFCHDVDPSWSGDTRFTISVAVAPKMMCLICHPERDHPAGFHHGVRPVEVSVPGDMRLDRYGFITCTTCHDVHEANPSARSSEGGDELCQRCHGK